MAGQMPGHDAGGLNSIAVFRFSSSIARKSRVFSHF
jgi:hypothetical protein